MGIFGIKRKRFEADTRQTRYMPSSARARWEQPVKEKRRKQAQEALAQKKREQEQKKREEKLAKRAKLYKAQTEVFKAKAERRKAKREAAFKYPILPTAKKVKIKRKKQGKKLSGKKKIGLI